MIDTTLERELREELEHLNPDQQRQVLDYARSLTNGASVGVPGTALLGFIGLIPPDDLKLMEEAIEEGCEQVDLDEW
jgi:hypothetical protein